MNSRVFTSGSLHVLEEACLAGLKSAQFDPLAPVSVLVPGNLLGLYLRRALALHGAGAGHANIRLMTLLDFARSHCACHLLQQGVIETPALVAELLFEQVALSVISQNGYFSSIQRGGELEPSLRAALTDLQEASISAEELELWAGRSTPSPDAQEKFTELARLYLAYEKRLSDLGFVERAHLIDEAASLISGAEESAFFVYGFYDFNPLQKQLIAKLVDRHQVLFFFPWHNCPAYEYALPCLTWLKSLGCDHVPLTADATRPLQRAVYSLFASPAEADPAKNAEKCVSIISAPGESREIHEAIRHALGWVRDEGLTFADIAILLRSSEPYAPLVVEALTHLGIPFYLSGGTPLIQTKAGQSFSLLVSILERNFSRTSVMEFTSYAPIDFDALGVPGVLEYDGATWDYFAIEAGIVAGKEQWRDRLERLRKRMLQEKQNSYDSDDIGRKQNVQSLERFQKFVETFFTNLAKLPPRGNWRDISLAVSALLRKLLLPTEDGADVADAIEGLAGLDVLEGEISLERFVRMANLALTQTRRNADGFGKGGIFVGDLMSARGLTFKGVIVPGMVEKFFPHAWRQDPILLDQERQALSEALGKEVAQKSRQYEEERLLFAFTLMAAKEKILFSYPRLDGLTGRERTPSYFLLRLMESMTGKPATFADFDRWEIHRRVPLSRLFPAEVSAALDPIEYDLCKADEFVCGANRASLAYMSTLAPFFDASLHAEGARWGERVFTRYDGALYGRQAQSRLRRLYRKQGLSISPTALERYARCPYRFLLETLLDLAPLEEPDPFAWVPALDRGALIHRILFRFIQQLKTEQRLPLKGQNPHRLESDLFAVASRILDAYQNEQAAGFPLLWELDKERMLRDLNEWLKAELQEPNSFVPQLLEQEFSYPFSLGRNGTIRLRGRVDRVDSLEEEGRARVIDYKTGRPLRLKDGEFRGGEALQLPLYLLACDQMLSGIEAVEAAYFYVGHDGRYRKDRFTKEHWRSKLATLRLLLAGLIANLRQGLFIARPPSCERCPFPWICTPAAGALFTRKRQDPRLANFERLKAIP